MNMMEQIVKDVIREEYGGCNPDTDNPCILKARVTTEKGYGKARILQIFVVGKWRAWTYVGYKGMPSNKKIKEAIRTVRFNTGSHTHDHKFNPDEGTFGGKEIMLEFIKIENAC